MKQTVLDVLVFLFEHCMEEDDRNLDHDALRGQLVEAGFPDGQITKAFDWLEALARHRESAASGATARNSSLRIFTATETEKLSRDGRGLLLYLEQVGVLDSGARELVIERAMALDAEEIGADELKWIVLMVLFNQPGNEEAFVWMEDLVMDELRGSLN
ncbi:MAG: Protein Smg [Gammaproteobacteria bacterium]|nr:Protein Smg [Gammaproteobacteria bacterium]